MKRTIGFITALLFSALLLAGCKSGLETTLSVADKIDEDINGTSSQTQQTTNATPPGTTAEVILNEVYYIKYSDDKSPVNMYKDASIDSKVIKKIKCKGKESVEVTVINKKNKDIWKVKCKGKTGYIHKKNLTALKQKSTSAATITTTQTTTSYQPQTQAQTQYSIPQTQPQTQYTYPKPTTKRQVNNKNERNKNGKNVGAGVIDI